MIDNELDNDKERMKQINLLQEKKWKTAKVKQR